MKAIMQQRSPSPSSLDGWNDLATIIGIPLGTILSLIGIFFMVKHHHEARRQVTSSSADNETLIGTPMQNTAQRPVHTETVGNLDEVFRLDPNTASFDISLPTRAATHPGSCNKAQPLTPIRASTYAGTTKRSQHLSLPLPPPPSLISSRASQLTLVDEEEHTNPTMIINYPSVAHMAPESCMDT